jgi:glycosyltransferase involved in cell wall biosynthesis
MKVLLSAYACEPGKGSEQGVGWHWATELVRLGHRVEVITRSNNRDPIEQALAGLPLPELHFHYYDLPQWAKCWKRGNRGVLLYYWLWQLGAARLARKLIQQRQFHLIHHLTFGVFRMPSFMGSLGVPFVIGPIGGGEAAPAVLRRSMPAKAAMSERVRALSNRLAFWNPSLSGMFRQAALIFCKTAETQAILPASCRKRCCVQLEIGLEPERILSAPPPPPVSLEFLFVGRLVYWKGLHLALKAFAKLRRERPEAKFTVIGRGSNEAQLKDLCAELGLQESVRWMGWLPQEELLSLYGRYTAFVFPSLHDSSGNVVLEALSQALPVICLDTGGPGAILPVSCGIKVAVVDRSERQMIDGLADAMIKIGEDAEFRSRMAVQALAFARANAWGKVVSGAYARIENQLESPMRGQE